MVDIELDFENVGFVVMSLDEIYFKLYGKVVRFDIQRVKPRASHMIFVGTLYRDDAFPQRGIVAVYITPLGVTATYQSLELIYASRST